MDINYKQIINEINEVLQTSDFTQIEFFANKIINSKRIIVFGAGRVGLVMKTFAMRLNHLNLKCNYLDEVSTPKTARGDLLIVASGSGNTKSTLSISEIALANNLDVICITSNNTSKIAKLCSSYILLNCQTKETELKHRKSIQPMTTLFEQALLIFLDSLVLTLMDVTNQTHESMLSRHNVIE
jgi:6-phospho-3-hexuloisomerase